MRPEGQAPIQEDRRPCKRRHQGPEFHSARHVQTEREDSHLPARKHVLARNRVACHPDLGLAASRTVSVV